MFSPGFRDLVKPQWLAILEQLRWSGGATAADLAAAMGLSYMGAKQHCEELVTRGYLKRFRLPRREVGRPQVIYRLSPKADGLFPGAGADLALGLLATARSLLGESAAEKMLHHHFQRLAEARAPQFEKITDPEQRLELLCRLRAEDGHVCRLGRDADGRRVLEEVHHPLRPLFERYPRAVQLDLRMMETLLGIRLERREQPGGPDGPARVEYLPEGA